MDEKPVWMEDWCAQGGPALYGPEVILRRDPDGVAKGYKLAAFTYVYDDDRAQLAAAAPALVRALLLAEWGCVSTLSGPLPRPADDGRECGGCGYDEPHDDGCPVDSALTLAGFPDQASRDAARALIKADGGARG